MNHRIDADKWFLERKNAKTGNRLASNFHIYKSGKVLYYCISGSTNVKSLQKELSNDLYPQNSRSLFPEFNPQPKFNGIGNIPEFTSNTGAYKHYSNKLNAAIFI